MTKVYGPNVVCLGNIADKTRGSLVSLFSVLVFQHSRLFFISLSLVFRGIEGFLLGLRTDRGKRGRLRYGKCIAGKRGAGKFRAAGERTFIVVVSEICGENCQCFHSLVPFVFDFFPISRSRKILEITRSTHDLHAKKAISFRRQIRCFLLLAKKYSATSPLFRSVFFSKPGNRARSRFFEWCADDFWAHRFRRINVAETKSRQFVKIPFLPQISAEVRGERGRLVSTSHVFLPPLHF